LRRAFDLAAGDTNMVVRINAAIALDQVAAERPDAACEALLSWASLRSGTERQQWACWWTAVAAVTLLVENERRRLEDLSGMFAQLLEPGHVLNAKHTPRAVERVSSDVVWAMGICVGRDSEPGQVPLARTMSLLGSLLGQDPWHDCVIAEIFQHAATTETRQRTGFAKAVFGVIQEYLKPEHYQLMPTRRQIAVETYLNAGSAKWNEASRLMRELAQFEAYDYGMLRGRNVETLSLEWLGTGGLVLGAILNGGQSTLKNALPILRTMASVRDPFVRPIAPFVLTALADRYRGPVMETLETWARGPQWTLQLSAVEAASTLCLRGLSSDDQLLGIMTRVATADHPEVQGYLEDCVSSLAEVDLIAATQLHDALGEWAGQEVG
jgi:hypothetical protein